MVLNDVSKQYDRAEFLTSNRYVYIIRGIRGRTGRKTERERVTLTINQEEIFTLFVIKRYLVDRRPFSRGRTYARFRDIFLFYFISLFLFLCIFMVIVLYLRNLLPVVIKKLI